MRDHFDIDNFVDPEEIDEHARRRDSLRAVGATDEELNEMLPAEEWRPSCTAIEAMFRDGMLPERILAGHRARMAEEAAERRAAWRRALRDAGAPELHLRHVYDVEPDDGATLAAARRFLADKDALFLLLLGGVGTHKTGAAVWTMAQGMPKRLTGCRKSSRAFVAADKIAKLGGFEKADELANLERVDLLVVDDLGAEYGDAKGWFSSLFTALVNARYGAALRTIITSNLTAEQIKANYGERVADRVRECGIVQAIGGASMRRRRGEAK